MGDAAAVDKCAKCGKDIPPGTGRYVGDVPGVGRVVYCTSCNGRSLHDAMEKRLGPRG